MNWMKVTDTRNKHKQMEYDFILEKVSLYAAYKNNRGVARHAIWSDGCRKHSKGGKTKTNQIIDFA